MDNCIFCKIISGDIPGATIYEDDEFKAILDRFPASNGHILIIPKYHYTNIFDIDMEVAGRLFKLATKIANALRKTFNTENINILQNNGILAGQTVFHFHLHLIPRYENDKINIKWPTLDLTDNDIESIKADLISTL